MGALIVINRKNLVQAALLGAAISCPIPAHATFSSNTGSVTPSGLIITIKSASLISADNKQSEIFNGSYDAEFTRAGIALAPIPLTAVSMPSGRYIGVSISFGEAYQAKLNGDAYIGSAAAGVAAGAALYTTGATTTDGRLTGAVTATAGTAVYVSNIKNGGSSGCSGTCSSQTYFAQTACVATSTSKCKAGDQWVGGDGVTVPNLNVILDIYQAILVDASDKSLAKGPAYPYAVLGNPGAAIHLTLGNAALGANNVSMIFSGDKKLQAISSYSSGSVTGGPSGGTTSGVTATGSGTNAYGPTPVMSFDSATGQVKFAQGGCTNGTTCVSSGLATLDNVLQAVGSSVIYTCASDTTGALGFTYTGGTCAGVTTPSTFKVARIVDPTNIFGICASPVAGACSATSVQIPNTNADGYL